MRVHKQLEAAKNQLDRAIKLFFDEADYYSAATLAGASEEILGKMLEAQGEKNALKSLSSAIVEIHITNDVPRLRG
jgi:aryl-alcohol dehydrogenase-like predicted oxidoreductase